MKITDKEYHAIITEISERFLNSASITLPPKLTKAFTKAAIERDLDNFENPERKVTYELTMVTGDFREILGKMRRRNLRGPKATLPARSRRPAGRP